MSKIAVFDNHFYENKPRYLPDKLYRAICNRANPRTKKYMELMLKKTFPGIKIYLKSDLDSLGFSENIILLYPDSIGLGWGKLESKCRRMCQHITILNGRGRTFLLDQATRRELKIKRFLEISFFLELITMPLICLYGLLLAISDKLVGNAKS